MNKQDEELLTFLRERVKEPMTTAEKIFHELFLIKLEISELKRILLHVKKVDSIMDELAKLSECK